MSKISLDNIKDTLEPLSWKIISNEYINLNTEMYFKCPLNHDVYTSWGILRKNIQCPVCKQSQNILNKQVVQKHKNIKRTLALDQATHNTGYAIFDDTKLITAGVYNCPDGEQIQRISNIKSWLLSMIKNYNPDIVGIEGIQLQQKSGERAMGVTVFETLARLQGVLMITCYESKIPFQICSSNTWRESCGVKGKTRTDRKKSMQNLVRNWYNIEVSDDVSDAIGLGRYISNKFIKAVTITNWEI